MSTTPVWSKGSTRMLRSRPTPPPQIGERGTRRPTSWLPRRPRLLPNVGRSGDPVVGRSSGGPSLVVSRTRFSCCVGTVGRPSAYLRRSTLQRSGRAAPGGILVPAGMTELGERVGEGRPPGRFVDDLPGLPSGVTAKVSPTGDVRSRPIVTQKDVSHGEGKVSDLGDHRLCVSRLLSGSIRSRPMGCCQARPMDTCGLMELHRRGEDGREQIPSGRVLVGWCGPTRAGPTRAAGPL